MKKTPCNKHCFKNICFLFKEEKCVQVATLHKGMIHILAAVENSAQFKAHELLISEIFSFNVCGHLTVANHEKRNFE